MLRHLRFPLVPFLAFTVSANVPFSAMGQEHPVIASAADLPRHDYVLSEPPSAAFVDDVFLRETLPQLRADAEALLASHRIEDAIIRTRLHTGLAAIAVLQARSVDAERWVRAERAAQSKPQLRAIGLLLIDAMAAGVAAGPERRCAAMADRVTASMSGQDPRVVRDEVLVRNSQTQTTSLAYVASGIVVTMDAEYADQRRIGLMDGMMLAYWRALVEFVPGCREALTLRWRAWLDVPANAPLDIWPARQPDLAALSNAAPVAVAVWDLGVDSSLFPGQMLIDPAEPLDGRDNDGNGVVDDVHGPTFDARMLPSRADIQPFSAYLAPKASFALVLDKGQLDLDFGLDTPESRFLAARSREASLAEQTEDVRSLGEVFGHSHGTYVASIVADGAPFIRLMNARMITEGFDPDEVPISEVENDRWLAALPGLGARLRGANVRVVNMSWIVSVDGISDALLRTGLETDPLRAGERARAMYGSIRTGLSQLMRECPDILFVAAAGNSNQSDATLGAVPQTIDAPNLIVVGAVGTSGMPTSFTTFGERVSLYAQGEAVRGRWPGGTVGHGSGTSYAAPAVSRAAATMLAANPALNSAQLIEGLRATTTQGEGGIRLLHSAAALAWAQARR